ncbi:MAG: hypothetical protein ACOYXR_04990 [Nitrospirota bacterium]
MIRAAGMAAVLLPLALAVPPAVAAPSVSFGIELGVVSRDIEEEGGLQGGTVSSIVDSTRLTARVSVALAPGVTLFGEAGGADLAMTDEGYRSDMHLSYGGGIRLASGDPAYPRHPSVFADLRVNRVATDDQLMLDWCDDSTCATSTARLSEEDLSWTEYAVGLGVMGRVQGLRPFGGVQFSKLDGADRARAIDGSANEARLDVRESNSVGFFFGADLPLDRSERRLITIRFSGIDDNAFRVAYTVAF